MRSAHDFGAKNFLASLCLTFHGPNIEMARKNLVSQLEDATTIDGTRHQTGSLSWADVSLNSVKGDCNSVTDRRYENERFLDQKRTIHSATIKLCGSQSKAYVFMPQSLIFGTLFNAMARENIGFVRQTRKAVKKKSSHDEQQQLDRIWPPADHIHCHSWTETNG